MKSLKKRLGDIIFIFAGIVVFIRVVVPEQYLMLRSGVWENHILYEESCNNWLPQEPQQKFLFYESADGKRFGLLELSKGRFLLWDSWKTYRRKEFDSVEEMCSDCSNAGSFSASYKTPYLNGQAVFSETYRVYPRGLMEQEEMRYIYCGRVSRSQPPEWFRELEWEKFRFYRDRGAYIYFYIDSPVKEADLRAGGKFS